MKKLLIAAAAMAVVAGAQAQSSVTVYGIMDLGINSVESKNTGATNESYSTTGQGKGSLSSNRIGFKGTEDLGGGLKANFVFEFENGAATGDLENAQRESWVELADDKMGSLRLGRTTGLAHRVVAGNLASGANNAVGSLAYYSAVTGTSTLTNTAANRIHGIGTSQVFVDRAITYVSPTVGGLTVSGQYAEDNTNDTTSADADRVSTQGVSVGYTAGKLTLSAVSTQINTKTASSADTLNKFTAYGATYDFGVAKAYVLNATNKTKNGLTEVQSAKDTVTSVGFQIPLSAKVNAWVEYGDGETDTGTASSSYDRDGYQVGVRYSLSKRTDLYAVYGDQEAKKVSDGAKSTLTGYAAGIRHTF
jgi:predicted porin